MSSVSKIHHYLLKSHFLKSLRSSSLEENGSSFIAYMYSIIKSVIIQSFIHLTNHCFEVCNSFWTLESRNSVTFDGAPHAGQGSDDGRTVTPSRRRGLKSSMRSLSLWYAFLLSQLGTQNMGTYLYVFFFSFFPLPASWEIPGASEHLNACKLPHFWCPAVTLLRALSFSPDTGFTWSLLLNQSLDLWTQGLEILLQRKTSHCCEVFLCDMRQGCRNRNEERFERETEPVISQNQDFLNWTAPCVSSMAAIIP